MAKILECAKVDPSSGCQHVVRGETEEESSQKRLNMRRNMAFGKARPSSWRE